MGFATNNNTPPNWIDEGQSFPTYIIQTFRLNVYIQRLGNNSRTFSCKYNHFWSEEIELNIVGGKKPDIRRPRIQWPNAFCKLPIPSSVAQTKSSFSFLWFISHWQTSNQGNSCEEKKLHHWLNFVFPTAGVSSCHIWPISSFWKFSSKKVIMYWKKNKTYCNLDHKEYKLDFNLYTFYTKQTSHHN